MIAANKTSYIGKFRAPKSYLHKDKQNYSIVVNNQKKT